MDEGGIVAIPLTYFIGAIGTLASVIGVLFFQYKKVQDTRVTETRGDTERVLTALNDNTNALTRITDALSAGGK